MVMSKETWDAISEKIVDKALDSHDPIGHLGLLHGVNVEIDDDVPFNSVEIYDRLVYEAIKVYGRNR